jgi:hypothetical protein
LSEEAMMKESTKLGNGVRVWAQAEKAALGS